MQVTPQEAGPPLEFVLDYWRLAFVPPLHRPQRALHARRKAVVLERVRGRLDDRDRLPEGGIQVIESAVGAVRVDVRRGCSVVRVVRNTRRSRDLTRERRARRSKRKHCHLDRNRK